MSIDTNELNDRQLIEHLNDSVQLQSDRIIDLELLILRFGKVISSLLVSIFFFNLVILLA